MQERPPLLEIDNLSVAYLQDGEYLNAVRDFSLRIHAGQTYALVGESGSGKSTVAHAIMRYLGQNGRITSGSIKYDGQDLLSLSEDELRAIWGKHMALVPQDPLSSLNPSIRVGEQIAEVLRRHENMSRSEATARTEELLRMVRVPDPDRVQRSYPHQISGGMQQRVLIAMALSTEPQLLILDEPTTGLDVTTQAAVLDLFRDLVSDIQAAVLYVTHNLGVVANLCDNVAVLYAGEMVEDAPVRSLFEEPIHPYSVGLMESVPQVGQTKSQVTLRAIPGQIPALGQRPQGCVFAPRCALAIDQCLPHRPSLDTAGGSHTIRCFRWQEIVSGEISARTETAEKTTSRPPTPLAPVLQLEDIDVYYEMGKTLSDTLRRRPAPQVKAVTGVEFMLDAGRTIGIVGESGSGKTSLARAIVGLEKRTGGEMTLLGVELPADLSARSKETLQHVQYVFQNPEEALNPHLTIGQSLSRPFISLLNMSQDEADEEVLRLLASVRLPASYTARFPNQLSGGEKQRVAIARAFATSPELLITDEPVSALDVSVQASILNLLRALQVDSHNSLLFISHDLAVVGYLADEIAVMYLGHIMEMSAASRLFLAPMHPYTEALLNSIPTLEPGVFQRFNPLEGDVPSQVDIPDGCPFHTRCPRLLGEICRSEMPSWQTSSAGDQILCHIAIADLETMQSGMGTAGAVPRESKPLENGKAS